MSDPKKDRIEEIREEMDEHFDHLEALRDEMLKLKHNKDGLYIEHAWSFMGDPTSRIIVPIGVN
jgi:hypothetical protein